MLCKLFIFIFIFLFLFITPTAAFTSDYIGVDYYEYTTTLTTRTYIYEQRPIPIYLNINFSIYPFISDMYLISVDPLAAPEDFNFISDFEVKSGSIIVGSGEVSVWKNVGGYIEQEFTFDNSWNTSFISEHQSMTVLDLICSNHSYNSIPRSYISSQSTNKLTKCYTHGSNDDLFLGSTIYTMYGTSQYAANGNQVLKYNTTFESEEFIDSWINFNPDVDSTYDSQLYYDYTLGVNYTEYNTFVYSFYEPETVNFATFEGYTNASSDTNVSMSEIYEGGNYSINLYYSLNESVSLDNAILIDSDDIFYNGSFTETLQYTEDSYIEYGESVVNYNVTNFKLQYPNDTFYVYMETPQSSYSPYFYYEIYELTGNYGQRSLEIGEKSSLAPDYQTCNALIYKSNATHEYQSMYTYAHANVTSYNHTLLYYTNYDYLINQSYITGQYISVSCDIEDYIETDYLGYPDEYFQLWVYVYSNSNEGNKHETFPLDSSYWSGNSPYSYSVHYDPYDATDFNATIESYITVYRLGNSTQLTPTIYSNMYSEGYIPEGEFGYIPPDFPEVPDEPEIPDSESDPFPEPDPYVPEIPPNGSGANQTVNVSFTGGYYVLVNDSVGALFHPVYNFTSWSLIPVVMLNSSISGFNDGLNTSFGFAGESLGILFDPLLCIFDALPPKVVHAVSYYLVLIVLLIILGRS